MYVIKKTAPFHHTIPWQAAFIYFSPPIYLDGRQSTSILTGVHVDHRAWSTSYIYMYFVYTTHPWHEHVLPCLAGISPDAFGAMPREGGRGLLSFTLPSDNVPHDLQHWSPINFPKKESRGLFFSDLSSETWRARRRSFALSPFRTAVPFWGQIPYNLTSLSPKRDCGSKREHPTVREGLLHVLPQHRLSGWATYSSTVIGYNEWYFRCSFQFVHSVSTKPLQVFVGLR